MADRPAQHTDEEAFAELWFREWRFCADGKPEDAASYLEGVLRAIADGDEYVRTIGGIDGQQEFVFQWLRSVGLVSSNGPVRQATLTPKGQRVLPLLERGSYWRAFDVTC